MEESIIYLPTQCEDRIQICRVVYDAFFLDEKVQEWKRTFLCQSIDYHFILSSFERFSYTVCLGEYLEKSYYLFNHFCFFRNYVCYHELSLEYQQMYLRFLKEFLTLFSFDYLGIVTCNDYESRYPKCLIRQAFEVQKMIASSNQFVLAMRERF